MRLLQTRLPDPGEHPLAFKTVHNPEDVKYAILSHVWGDDEVLYEDVTRKTGESREGFAKVHGALQQARNAGYDYIWIDNVCIDKSSSSELQEAINSMYAWYRKAAICYAHLADILPDGTGLHPPMIGESRWFKRGWTLQELIAPQEVRFFYTDWTYLGDKVTLSKALSAATRIHHRYLTGESDVNLASIAERMSWAAERQTTRAEDRAYSLMGLFNVNMPMLYGEGAVNAFTRLQEEIMRRSDDQSLFAWCDERLSAENLHGLLADTPDAFYHEDLLYVQHNRDKPSVGPYAMTNRGLQISLELAPEIEQPYMVYTAVLNCFTDNPERPLKIYLLKLNLRDNVFVRIKCNKPPIRQLRLHAKANTEAIYIPQSTTRTYTEATQPREHFIRFTKYGLRKAIAI